MRGGSHKRASCEISVRYPRSECTIRSRHQMARMRVHRHSKCCRYASAAGKIVASVSVCRPRWPHGGNLKHSHTLKIRRPSVLTPGKYPASLSQLRILRSNYEYGTVVSPLVCALPQSFEAHYALYVASLQHACNTTELGAAQAPWRRASLPC